MPGAQQRDDRRAARDQGDLGVGWRLHLRDDLGAGKGRGGVGRDTRAGGNVGVVAKAGGEARPPLNDDVDSQFFQTTDAIRRDRDALFAWRGFGWYTELHGLPVRRSGAAKNLRCATSAWVGLLRRGI